MLEVELQVLSKNQVVPSVMTITVGGPFAIGKFKMGDKEIYTIPLNTIYIKNYNSSIDKLDIYCDNGIDMKISRKEPCMLVLPKIISQEECDEDIKQFIDDYRYYSCRFINSALDDEILIKSKKTQKIIAKVHAKY